MLPKSKIKLIVDFQKPDPFVARITLRNDSCQPPTREDEKKILVGRTYLSFRLDCLQQPGNCNDMLEHQQQKWLKITQLQF
jgi:hypothetical protein